MRRGLISWSRTELPERVLDSRVARTQAAMARANVDALAVYSDPSRSAGASWLTAFVPYWNRGVVVLPRAGRPILFTGMSNRVHGWIKSNAHLEAVVYSTNFGADAAKAIAEKKPDAVVALPDSNAVPGAIVEGLTANGISVVDGTALMEKLRAPADATELAFYFRAASIARAGLARAGAAMTDAAALVGAVEGEARRLGAEEIYVGIAPDLDAARTLIRLEGNAALGRRFAVRASVAYKGTWVRMVRSLAREPAQMADIAAATERFSAAVAELPDTSGMAGFKSWLVEGCRATQPLELLAGSMVDDRLAIAPGTVVSTQVTLESAHGPILLGAPALVGQRGEASSFLVQPPVDD